MYKIDCMSDTHSLHRKMNIDNLGGDMVIHAGDFTATGKGYMIEDFALWYKSLPYRHHILIAGNHDFDLQNNEDYWKNYFREKDIIYLRDNFIIVDGISIYGMPWTPEFYDWAFMYEKGSKFAYDKIDLISDNLDILVTHGPPMGIMDIVRASGENIGCNMLLQKVLQVKPKYHVFGHAHHQYGIKNYEGITFVKPAILNEQRILTNNPITIWM